MQLTLYTDYALRVLIYLSLTENGATVSEIAEAYGISKNHLVKVAHNLGKKGYIHTARGRSGGLSLAKKPKQINVGKVVRDMESHFDVVECFDKRGNKCVITPGCRLIGALSKARRGFWEVLNSYTLSDVLDNADELREMLNIEIAEGVKN